jgi:hypothetical protein
MFIFTSFQQAIKYGIMAEAGEEVVVEAVEAHAALSALCVPLSRVFETHMSDIVECGVMAGDALTRTMDRIYCAARDVANANANTDMLVYMWCVIERTAGVEVRFVYPGLESMIVDTVAARVALSRIERRKYDAVLRTLKDVRLGEVMREQKVPARLYGELQDLSRAIILLGRAWLIRPDPVLMRRTSRVMHAVYVIRCRDDMGYAGVCDTELFD